MRRLAGAAITLVLALFVAVGVIVAASGLWFRQQVYGDRTLPVKSTQLIIPKGATFSEISTQLADAGVIHNRFAFRILARLRRADADVHAGEFRFAPHQNESDILRELQTGGAQIAAWVTIPEGFTAREIAQRLSDQNLAAQSDLARVFLHDSLNIDGQRTRNLEGFLFPSTYLMPTGASPQALAKIMTDEFRKALPADARQQSQKLHYTIPQIVTLASLIEREAKSDDERPLMAGVYYNRLRVGMPLEVDATIEYVFPEHKTEITKADLQIDSPYNTYKHMGLPPTPIANAGRPSIWAAFHPQRSEYLYYVYKGNGHHAFAKTLSEHNANVSRYLK